MLPCTPASLSELSRLFTYLEAGDQDSRSSTTSHGQCGQLGCVSVQGPLVEKVMTRFLGVCVQAEWCWWGKGG